MTKEPFEPDCLKRSKDGLGHGSSQSPTKKLANFSSSEEILHLHRMNEELKNSTPDNGQNDFCNW